MSGQDNCASQDDLARRIAQLEKQHRRMKRIGFFLLLAIPGSFILLGQTQPKQQTIEASGIVIRDGAGRVRATLSVKEGDASFELYDKEGNSTLSLSSLGAAFLFAHNGLGKGVALSGTESSFTGAGGSTVSYLNANALGLQKVRGHMRVQVTADQEAGAVFVGDANGFKAVLGTSYLQNVTRGGSEKTSAASLAFFNPQNKAI